MRVNVPSNTILIGPDTNSPLYRFENAGIREITSTTAVDIVGAELSIDQLTPKVEYDVNAAELWTPSDYSGILSSDGYLWATNRTFDDIRTLNYGEVVRYYHDGKLAGKFYIKNIDRISKDVYQINAMSAVGLLDGQRHVGGIYTGQTFQEVADEIIGGAISFSCEDDVSRLLIYGWLPISSKRKNLHQLMFACGVTLTKDENGDIVFSFLYSGAPIDISDSQIYCGGNVDYSSPASAVEITEHTYEILDDDEEVTLFDNTDGSGAADNTFVSFQDAPVHDLAASEGLSIVGSGVNYAIVTGTGILTGKKYTHVTRVLAKNTNGAGEENIVTVEDATLVSVANSENVAKRVLSYYSSKKTIGAAIVVNGEKAGQQIRFTDPYDEKATGFLATMEINVSSNLKAQCTIITDYVPTGQGNNYTNYVLLAGKGTWNIPAEVLAKEDPRIKVVLVGGGQAGGNGGNGEAGKIGDSVGATQYTGTGGDGGKGGTAGSGGKIFTTEISVNGINSIPYYCGKGGQENAEDGEATTFGNYSSANGASSIYGTINIFTGEIYGIPGKPGIAGGKGNEGGDETVNGFTVGLTGEDYGSARGGAGGGASGNANGGNGGNAQPSTREDGSYFLHPGNGGAGANGAAGVNATTYGGGGNGGNGGGGGGGSGGFTLTIGVNAYPASVGSGGSGGKGGTGEAGCIIVFY